MDINNQIFKAIKENDKIFFKDINIYDIEIINFKLFKNESNNEWYNYIKGMYYFTQNNKVKAIYYFNKASINPENTILNKQISKIYKYWGNNSKAIYYLELASKYKDGEACNDLGELYENELFDYEKSIYYYDLAIKYGIKKSYYSLGKIYANVINDYVKAIYYFESLLMDKNVITVDKFDCGTKLIIRKIYDIYINNLIDYEKAIYWARKINNIDNFNIKLKKYMFNKYFVLKNEGKKR